MTGSLPERPHSGGVPYLFIEVEALQPYPTGLADKNAIHNSTNGSNDWHMQNSGSGGKIQPRMSNRMELWVVLIGSWSK